MKTIKCYKCDECKMRRRKVVIDQNTSTALIELRDIGNRDIKKIFRESKLDIYQRLLLEKCIDDRLLSKYVGNRSRVYVTFCDTSPVRIVHIHKM